MVKVTSSFKIEPALVKRARIRALQQNMTLSSFINLCVEKELKSK